MKAILLVRVSTAHQDLSQQTDKVKAEALKDGYEEKDIIILEDKESAVKLSEEERNGLNNLKWHIENDDISCVYSYEVSRISRQAKILYSIRDYLIEHNVQLIILKPYIKLLNDDGTISETSNLFFGLFTSLAENEGYLRKQRCKRGMDKKKKLGLYSGGNVPTGYKVVKEKFVIDEQDAILVKRIFTEYAEGKSIRLIGRDLLNEGLWWGNASEESMKQNILNIIHRKYYCGDDMHPAIITEDLYDKVQQKCKNKTSYKKGTEDTSLFRGMITDKNGKTLTTNIVEKFYYCKGTTISFKVTDAFIWGVAKEWYGQIYNYKRKEIIEGFNKSIEAQQNIINTMSKRITDNQDKIDRIEERYIDGKITKERADELERKAFFELQANKRSLDQAKAEISRLNDMINNDNRLIMISEHMSLEDKRTVIRYVIDRIIVQKKSFYVAEIIMTNKITGETRILDIHTRRLEILKIEFRMRPWLISGL